MTPTPQAGTRLLLLAASGLALVALAGCGGGGGGGVPINAPSAVLPAPTPAPTPTPTPVNYDTAEYRRSNAAVSANAISLWTAGVTGQSVTVAVIDSGLADSSPEFTGRISPASRDVGGQSRPITDTSGHGTSVSAVLAAARNDSGILGVAHGATLAVMKADSPGTCATTDGCRYSDSALAAGVDAAIAAGARAINISLGGSSAAAGPLRNAFARAAAAGVVIVVAAGNDGEAQVDPLAQGALAVGRGNVIIAAGRNESGTFASFSNQAGTAQANVVTALAERVRSFDHTGTAYFYSGNSFATPQVTAAVALLAQAFPNLTGAQIVELILANATDAGAPGTDAVFGRGNLNIARAFAPSGSTSLAGTATPISLSANGSLGPSLGGGTSFGAALGSVPVVDGYGRTYQLQIGGTLRPAPAARPAGALQLQSLHTAETQAGFGGAQFGVAVRAIDAPGSSAAQSRQSHLGLAQRGLDAHAGDANPIRETRLSISTDNARFALATGPSAAAILPGSAAPGLIAPDGLEPEPDPARTDRRLGMAEMHFGSLHLAAAAGTGRTRLPTTPGLARATDHSRLTLAATVPAGPLTFSTRLTRLYESGSLLGSNLGPAFGVRSTNSTIAGAAIDLAVAGFAFRAAASQGRHAPSLGQGLLASAHNIHSSGWSLAASHPAARGTLTLRLAQPLVVTSGQVALATGAAAPLAPGSRERAAELGWTMTPTSTSVLSITLYRRQNAGHVAALSDSGAALILSGRF